jgi:uncharacterized membrane protein (UPF0127 family)
MRAGSVLCLALFLACARTEQQPTGGPGSVANSSRPGTTVLVTPAAPAPSWPPPVEARCLWPMLSLAPPQATRAARCPPDDLLRPPSLPHGRVVFADAPGRPRVEIELAVEPADQTRGLMFRKDLAPNAGMLFWGEQETVRRFWMHNTCIPLDMLFVAKDLVIVGILEQVPVMSDESRGVPCASAHVLEVNAGWARDHGVRPGQRVIIER